MAVPAALLLCAATALPQGDLDALRREAFAMLERQRPALEAMSDDIWRHAERALEEHRSAAAIAGWLEEQGFELERGVAGMPTAFVATWGEEPPVLGILGEYDALPGLSNVAEPRRRPRVEGGGGHGCGHNLFGVASAAAAAAAKAVLAEHGLPGTVRYFGCPAEETLLGKVYMAKVGVFDGLDACLDWHPGTATGVDFSRSLAMNSFVVEFHGETAHGAADPWNGRSALDAVELMNHAVNLLREHVRPSTRIHYVIPDGGDAPNVVPGHAAVWYYVRDRDRRGVEATYARVLAAAEGAALAIETRHEVTLVSGVHSYLLNRPLAELLDRNLRAAGAPSWTDEQQEFARAVQRAAGVEELGMHEGIDDLPDAEEEASGGSTDVAEVSRLVPTAKLRVASAPREVPWHAWPVVACGGMSIGHEAMHTAARALAAALLELAVSPEELAAAREAFAAKTAGEPYRSPVPHDRPPSLPRAGSR